MVQSDYPGGGRRAAAYRPYSRGADPAISGNACAGRRRESGFLVSGRHAMGWPGGLAGIRSTGLASGAGTVDLDRRYPTGRAGGTDTESICTGQRCDGARRFSVLPAVRQRGNCASTC